MNKLLISILLLTSLSLIAQDKIAEEILDKLSEETKSYNTITIDFDFIIKNTTHNIYEEEKGKLEIEGNKFRITMNNQIIINDGETQWVYLTDVNEVQIMDHDPEDDVIRPNYILNIYKQGYKYSYVGKEEKNLEVIDLFPKESSDFMKITLTINTLKNQLHKISMKDKNGGEYTYQITLFRNNTTLEPFKLNTEDLPNVEFIDLR